MSTPFLLLLDFDETFSLSDCCHDEMLFEILGDPRVLVLAPLASVLSSQSL